MNLKLVRLLLDGEGYDVQPATDSTEALRMVAGFHPRLILMDIQLPGMDGLALTRLLKSDPAQRDLVIVALTAHTMTGVEEAARNAGCDGYVTKPIDTRTFPATLKQYLRERPAVAPTLQVGDYRDLLAELRSSFLIEGMEEGQLLCGFAPEFDAERARMISHRWAGIAGTLGFDEIGRKARSIEKFLENPAGESRHNETPVTFRDGEYRSQLRTELLELLQMFSDAVRGKQQAAALPAAALQALTGTAFALIGFGKGEASRMSRAFAQARAFASVFQEPPGLEGLQYFHGAIVNLCEERGASSRIDPAALAASNKPVLLVGSSAEILFRWQQKFRDRASDFVLAPWDSDEVVLRAQRLLLDRTEPSHEHSPR